MGDKGYDPRLRDAMKDIEEVLKKHDIGAFVSLHSPTHGEFRMFSDTPTWSNQRFVRDGKAVHVKLYMKSDKWKTECTVAMLASMKDLCAIGFGQADQIMKMIEHHSVVEHVPFGKYGITNDDREDGS